MKRSVLAFPPLLLLAGCSDIQSVLAPAGEQAGSLFSLLLLMVAVCGFMFALVVGFLALGILRKRRPFPPEQTAVEPPDGGLHRILAIWAGLIVVGLTVLITASFFVDRGLVAKRDEEVLAVRVTGHQWWWRIEYRDPTGDGWIETANELHLPLGRTARIELQSADVIHSFWVPNLAGKMDVIPGRTNSIDLTPNRTGWFRGQCGEYCGVQHAHMGFDVKVETAEEFGAWLNQQNDQTAPAPSNPLLARGEALTTQSCGLCHTIRGTAANGEAGPDLTHIASRRSIAAGVLPMSRGALQGWIAQPQAVKPGTLMPVVPLAPADADAVAHYLSTLK